MTSAETQRLESQILALAETVAKQRVNFERAVYRRIAEQQVLKPDRIYNLPILGWRLCFVTREPSRRVHHCLGRAAVRGLANVRSTDRLLPLQAVLAT
jgi:hypothetical protein